jgi:anti-sigma B factor antagonist
MKIECLIDNDKKVKTFKIEGELDVHHVKNLKSKIMDTVEEPSWTYVLDMNEVGYLDSSGLGMLVYLKKEIAKHEGELKIINLHEPVMNVFKLTKLDDFFGLS